MKPLSLAKTRDGLCNRNVRKRCGFTLLEISVAAVLLITLMAISVQVLARVAAERLANRRRQCATQEAANAMDRLTTLPWQDLHLGKSKQELSFAARELLPDGYVEVHIVDEPGDVPSKRITVEVYWQGRTGQRQVSVRLTSWVYRKSGERE